MTDCECIRDDGVLSVMCLNCSEDVWEALAYEQDCVCGFLSAISVIPVTRPCGALACVNNAKGESK